MTADMISARSIYEKTQAIHSDGRAPPWLDLLPNEQEFWTHVAQACRTLAMQVYPAPIAQPPQIVKLDNVTIRRIAMVTLDEFRDFFRSDDHDRC